MAIRIRNVNGELVALCAAETKLEPGDLYFDDVVDSALRKKFLEDYKKEGLIEVQAEPSEAEVGEFIGEQAHLFKRQWPDRFYGDGSIDFYVFDNLKKVLKEYDKLRRGK